MVYKKRTCWNCYPYSVILGGVYYKSYLFSNTYFCRHHKGWQTKSEGLVPILKIVRA